MAYSIQGMPFFIMPNETFIFIFNRRLDNIYFKS